MNEPAHTRASIVIVDRDPAFFETVRPIFQAKGYTPLLTRWHEDVSATIAQHQPIAVVINLSATDPLAWQVLTALQDDPATRHTPVVVCSDNVTLLQDAVTSLRQRPGSVLASSCNADELLAKLPAPAGETDAA